VEKQIFRSKANWKAERHHTKMKTIEQIHEEIQAALKAARETHEYRAEGASIEFTNAMLT